MKLQEAIEFFGSQSELARALGLSRQAINNQLKLKVQYQRLPLHHQMYLEKITGGKLKSDPHPAELKKAKK